MERPQEAEGREQKLLQRLEERYRRKLEPVLGPTATEVIIKMIKEDTFYELGTAALVVKRLITSGESYPERGDGNG